MSFILQKLINFIRHILTGKDNSTYDIARVSSLLVLLVGLSLETYMVIKTGQFDIESYFQAGAIFLTGSGLGVFIKHTTEPNS